MEDEIKRKPGPRRCKKCGEYLPKICETIRTNHCIFCLREMTEAPPYPCTECEFKGQPTCMRHLGLRACEAWTDWAMVTWRLTIERLMQRVEKEKDNA